jgi:hypothetical protein
MRWPAASYSPADLLSHRGRTTTPPHQAFHPAIIYDQRETWEPYTSTYTIGLGVRPDPGGRLMNDSTHEHLVLLRTQRSALRIDFLIHITTRGFTNTWLDA